MADQTHLEELTGATHRLVRTVDSMVEEQYDEPSLLPGWNRGHVVAHLALNAEGFAAALRGLTDGRSVPMYASQEDRDGDIATLGKAEPEVVRSRFLGGVTDFVDAVTAVPEEAWDVDIERTPGGRTFPARTALDMRHREVEIHHADLGLGYTHRDWPEEFAVRLMEAMVRRNRETPLTVHASDLDRTWHVGGGGPVVTGSAVDLGWWLTGRGDGSGLTSDGAELPAIQGW